MVEGKKMNGYDDDSDSQIIGTSIVVVPVVKKQDRLLTVLKFHETKNLVLSRPKFCWVKKKIRLPL